MTSWRPELKTRRNALVVGILFLIAGGAVAGNGTVEIRGAFDGTIDGAIVNTAFNERAGIWMLQLRSPREYKDAHGVGFYVNLFFSREFEPSEGTFPVVFSYLSKPDSLGGSVRVSGEGRGTFSHDTSGEVTFTSMGDQIEGSFAFETFDGSDDSRRRIEVQGTFSCPRGEAFE